MPKAKKKTKRPRKTTPSSRGKKVVKRKTTKRQKQKFTWITPFIRKIHRRKHFTAIIFIVVMTYGFLVSTIPTQPADTRADRLKSYMTEHNMPIAENAETFVNVADHYDIDWQLLPAIAVQESSGGKRMQNNNPFGWGSAKIPFETIDDAIWEVGRNLSGNNERTAKWYSTTSTYKKLYYYNGTVMPTYPDEVMWIMEQF